MGAGERVIINCALEQLDWRIAVLLYVVVQLTIWVCMSQQTTVIGVFGFSSSHHHLHLYSLD